LPFDENNVKAIKGRYDKTLAAPVKFDVGLAHIDCDWYDSVMACLTALEPKIVKGGVLILDDYYAFPGCRDAVKDYFDQNGRRDRYSFIGQPEKAVMHIIQT
jgi:asparagine synthase (glutamine-hydrolysing)